MKLALFSYTRQGCATARRIRSAFSTDEIRAFAVPRCAETGFAPIESSSPTFYGELFHWADALIFVGSIGIAVREIAPHIQSKSTDPAVLSVDELARFVVPLLSGHIGGANALALRVAEWLDATPVITTATDINRKFSVDAWATHHGLLIDSLAAAKAVSAAILERDVPLCADFPIVTPLPNGVKLGERGALGICVSCQRKTPFSTTLLLVPPALHLGIGCRRGTPAERIREAVAQMLAAYNIHPKAIARVASIDLKADEAGLLQFCQERALPAQFYSAAALRSVSGEFTPSERVLRYTGVDNVCERAAMMGAARLLVKKTAQNGVTVAVAAEDWEVRFG